MIQIAHKIISPRHPVFIIAEAGVNHNGDLRLAKKLIDAAAAAGADAVKFQTFHPDTLVTATATKADYQITNEGAPTETQHAMLKRLMLKRQYHAPLKAYAEQKKIIFLSTPFSHDDALFLHELGVPAFKVGSSDANNIPFLRALARKKLPIILSTGMATLKEIKASVETIHKAGNRSVVILQCTTDYPCPLEEVNLRAMQTLKRELGVLVGFSDHTTATDVPALAVAMGAVVIEKHLTLDRTLPGPDHAASLEPREFAEMVRRIRTAEQAMGHDKKLPTASEKVIAKVARKSIVAARDITSGRRITVADLIIKRPGTGIAPAHLDALIGKKTTRNIRQDELIRWQDITSS